MLMNHRKFITSQLLMWFMAVSLILACGSPESNRDQGALATTPWNIHFHATQVGSTAERTLTLINWGEGLLRLEIDIMGEDDDANSVFYLDGNRSDTLEIEGGQEFDVIIEYSPLENRSYEGVIRITKSDNRDWYHLVHMVADAAEPELFVESPVKFPAVSPGSSFSVAVQLQNIGSAPLTLENVVTSGSEFSILDFERTTIAPEEYEVVMVDFTPLSDQPVTGEMTIFSNDRVSEYSVSLEGNQ